MDVMKLAKSDEVEAPHLAMWEYALSFAPMAVLRCAIELQIAEAVESHGGAMTHAELSTALGCSPSILHRIMRYLIHLGFFKKQPSTGQSEPSSPFRYVHTPLSKQLMRNSKEGINSVAALVLLQSSPAMIAPWHKLSSRALTDDASAFGAAHGKDLWAYASENPEHNKLFNDGMASHAKSVMCAVADCYPEAFEGIGSVVDVGGGDGTALRTLVEECPWIRGINFDLPHVVAVAPPCDGIEHVGGDMFEMVPKADAAFLMVRTTFLSSDF